jgi:hypothetical protein
MKLTRKLQLRSERWATIAVPNIVLRSDEWTGCNSVIISFDPDAPDVLTVRPVFAGDNQE